MRILVLTLVMSFLSHSTFSSEDGGAKAGAKRERRANDTDKSFFPKLTADIVSLIRSFFDAKSIILFEQTGKGLKVTESGEIRKLIKIRHPHVQINSYFFAPHDINHLIFVLDFLDNPDTHVGILKYHHGKIFLGKTQVFFQILKN